MRYFRLPHHRSHQINGRAASAPLAPINALPERFARRALRSSDCAKKGSIAGVESITPSGLKNAE
jgi:hypothetical protein